MDKAEVARRQLGAALDMFIADLDPVSVHCLACGGSEIAESLAKKMMGTAFIGQILQSHPSMNEGEVRAARTRYWNAFKHAYTRAGKVRDESDLLRDFSEVENDSALFMEWYDYTSAGNAAPIAAQVFSLWFFSLHEPELAKEFGLRAVGMFDGIRENGRRDQISSLRERIGECEAEWGSTPGLGSDHRPLTIPAGIH